MIVKFEEINLEVREDPNHDWLLETSLVAQGYGINEGSLRSTKSRNEEELVEGKHFIVLQNATGSLGERTKVFWTKKGVIRLGFFIKSEKAKLFRDWAEDLVIKAAQPVKALSPKELALMVIAAEEEKERLASELDSKQVQLQLAETTIKKQAPKVQYHDAVLQSDSLINTNVIAKDLGMTAIQLNRILKTKDVQYLSGTTWVLKREYQNKGYTHTKTHTYTDKEGKQQTSIHTYWTEAGRQFIFSLFQK